VHDSLLIGGPLAPTYGLAAVVHQVGRSEMYRWRQARWKKADAGLIVWAEFGQIDPKVAVAISAHRLSELRRDPPDGRLTRTIR